MNESTFWPAQTFYAVITVLSDDGRIIPSWFHLRDDSVEMACDFHIATSDFFSIYHVGTREEFELVYKEAWWRAAQAVLGVPSTK